jgi:hypothetical protein
MASLQEPIQQYRIHLVHNRSAGQPAMHTRTRYIQVLFTVKGATKPSMLHLGFIADAQSATTGEVKKLDTRCYQISARIPVSEFAAYYDVLRSEKPVSVWFDYETEPDLNQTVSINSFSLFTGDEPLGEGPVDVSA